MPADEVHAEQVHAEQVDAERVADVVRQVRERAPLVHCLTATVSMSLVADGLLAAGARPMMTETLAEAPTMTGVADALLVNLGTLSTDAMAGIEPTVAAASAAAHPWVLDPTAVGVAPVRTPLARRLAALGPTVVRGNASEVRVLAGEVSGGRGADAGDTTEDALAAATSLAADTGAVVAVSGATDLLTDGVRLLRVPGGSPLLPRVTGTGCLLGALTAACCAVTSPLDAAAASHAWLARAAELAATCSTGPGTFRVALLDSLDEVLR